MGLFDHKRVPQKNPSIKDQLEARVCEAQQKIEQNSPAWTPGTLPTTTDVQAVQVNNFPEAGPISGTVAVSGNVTVVQPAGAALHVDVDALPAITIPLPANAAVETGGHLASIDAKLTNPLPISSASLPLPANAAIETGGHLASIDTKLTNPLPVVEPTSTTASAPSRIALSGATVILAANANRKEVIVVNTDVFAVYLAFAAVPSTTVYHVVLAPCSTADDGTGGTFVSDIWKGQIQAISSGSPGHVVVTEMT